MAMRAKRATAAAAADMNRDHAPYTPRQPGRAHRHGSHRHDSCCRHRRHRCHYQFHHHHHTDRHRRRERRRRRRWRRCRPPPRIEVLQIGRICTRPANAAVVGGPQRSLRTRGPSIASRGPPIAPAAAAPRPRPSHGAAPPDAAAPPRAPRHSLHSDVPRARAPPAGRARRARRCVPPPHAPPPPLPPAPSAPPHSPPARATPHHRAVHRGAGCRPIWANRRARSRTSRTVGTSCRCARPPRAPARGAPPGPRTQSGQSALRRERDTGTEPTSPLRRDRIASWKREANTKCAVRRSCDEPRLIERSRRGRIP